MYFPMNERPRILLIDHNSLKQQIRAAIFRNCEVEVHTASNLTDAGQLWTRCNYDLVLFAAEEHSEEATALCEELRKSRPKQRIALLVGAPQYVREVGRKRKETPVVEPRPTLLISAPQTPGSQWQGTADRLLAAG